MADSEGGSGVSAVADAAAAAAKKALNELNKLGDKFKEEAAYLWANYKYYIIGGAAGAVVLLIIICCCCIRCCRKKKKKKNDEKIKLKGAKPKKKLKRIQPNKIERKAMERPKVSRKRIITSSQWLGAFSYYYSTVTGYEAGLTLFGKEELGTISFSLTYEKASEMLLVKVMEAEDIPVHDLSGYAYSFVVAKILPLHQDEETEFKTKPVRAGFWPAFGDVLSFVIDKDELEDQVLYLYQYELNRWSKHDGIGQIAFELKSANLLKDKTGEVEFKKKLRPYDPLIGLEVESGAVFLSLEYEPDTWELRVEVRQADIIPQNDEEKASSYVTIALLNKDDEILEKRKTDKVKGTLQPTYEDGDFQYTVPDNMLPDVQLVVKLKQPNLVKKASILGKSTILPTSDNWKQLLEKEYTSGWFPVYKKPKNK